MAEDFWTRYRALVDDQIRGAAERGAFDDLPGAGRPLALPAHDDEHWWVREKLRREGVSTQLMLPPGLRLRKEIEQLPAVVHAMTTEAALRAHLADLDTRIRRYVLVPVGPSVPLCPLDVEAVVAAWAAGRERERVAADRERAARPQPPVLPRRAWWRRRRRGAAGKRSAPRPGADEDDTATGPRRTRRAAAPGV